MALAWATLLLAHPPACGASPGLAPPVTHCHRVEFNTYGDQPRTAVIFWGADGQVIDWKWYGPTMEPRQVRPGCWAMLWSENGKLLHVTAESVSYSRTMQDVELAERARRPEHERRKLR